MPSQYSIADVLERIYQNQLALEAALGAIDENAAHIKLGLACLCKLP